MSVTLTWSRPTAQSTQEEQPRLQGLQIEELVASVQQLLDRAVTAVNSRIHIRIRIIVSSSGLAGMYLQQHELHHLFQIRRVHELYKRISRTLLVSTLQLDEFPVIQTVIEALVQQRELCVEYCSVVDQYLSLSHPSKASPSCRGEYLRGTALKKDHSEIKSGRLRQQSQQMHVLFERMRREEE